MGLVDGLAAVAVHLSDYHTFVQEHVGDLHRRIQCAARVAPEVQDEPFGARSDDALELSAEITDRLVCELRKLDIGQVADRVSTRVFDISREHGGDDDCVPRYRDFLLLAIRMPDPYPDVGTLLPANALDRLRHGPSGGGFTVHGHQNVPGQ